LFFAFLQRGLDGPERKSGALREKLNRKPLDQPQRVQHELERQLGGWNDPIFN
jgi:hypothetical protein